ncbi:MAG: maleylpyruvate isomerase family mycothiol-dependent enzyme [Acidimicrobiia bacterium]|nr:maleylpyruvate isomerase family mycothiol-dependent enzyme [Acidimicrobiia bacterium]
MLDDGTYLDQVKAQGDLLAATPPGVLAQRVPGCPDWDVAGLIGHTGWIFNFVTANLRAGGERVSAKSIAAAPSGPDVLPWFAEALGVLVTALDEVSPATEVHTFVGPRPAAFWRRRMAQETTVHRWDAESAHTTPAPVDAAMALDGIDESWDLYFLRRFDWGSVPAGATMHLHATDAPEGEWLVTFGADADATRVERGHAKADVAVRGTASDLLLFCFGRVPADQLDVVGEAQLAAAFQAGANY